MKARILLSFFFLAAFASCTQDEVIPRTNPRFSVAFAQSIDRSGAEFAAEMYDYGSEEILEYGFVYGRTTILKLTTHNFISEKGSPGKEFRLKSDHSMPLGTTIYVAAFIKTESGVVYSEPYSFVSQGSEGFIFERLVIPTEVYFGDTIRVLAKKLSRESQDYSVLIQGETSLVTSITDDSFDVIIPRSVGFDEGVGDVQNFEFEIKVSDKVLKINQPIKFKSPEFIVTSIGDLSYTDDFVIRGKYLHDVNLRIRYNNSFGTNFLLKLNGATDEALVIGLNALFTESNPKLEVVIRGQTYPLEGFLKLKGTTINPGQVSEFRNFFGTIKIKGENFNPFQTDYNQIEISPDIFKVDVLSVSPTEMEISFNYQFDKGPGTRITELRMVNAGISSTNSVKLEWTSPGIPFIITNDFSFTLGEGKTATVGEKAYMINTKGIYEIDPNSQMFNRIANSPTPGLNPASIFAISAEGKIYFGAYTNQEVRLGEKLFFEFDPSTRSVRSLPKIPSSDNSFQSVVYYQGGLYYQGDEIDQLGRDGNIKRYRFDLAAQSWEKLPDLYQPDEMTNSFSSFEYKGKIYSTSVYLPKPFFLGLGLYEFDTNIFIWKLLGPLSSDNSFIDGRRSFPIDDKVYILGRSRIYILDMITGKITAPDYLMGYSDFAQNENSFQIGDKFYLFTGTNFWQYDVSYFY